MLFILAVVLWMQKYFPCLYFSTNHICNILKYPGELRAPKLHDSHKPTPFNAVGVDLARIPQTTIMIKDL